MFKWAALGNYTELDDDALRVQDADVIARGVQPETSTRKGKLTLNADANFT